MASSYYLFRGAYLTFSSSYSVYRKFEVFDVDQELLEGSNVEPNMFFKLTIEYNAVGLILSVCGVATLLHNDNIVDPDRSVCARSER